MNRRGFLKSMAVAVPALLVPSSMALLTTEEHPLLGVTNQSMDTMTPITLASCKAAVEKMMKLEYVPEYIYMHPAQLEAFEREMKEIEMMPGSMITVSEHVKQGEVLRVKFPTPGNYKLKFQDRL